MLDDAHSAVTPPGADRASAYAVPWSRAQAGHRSLRPAAAPARRTGAAQCADRIEVVRAAGETHPCRLAERLAQVLQAGLEAVAQLGARRLGPQRQPDLRFRAPRPWVVHTAPGRRARHHPRETSPMGTNPFRRRLLRLAVTAAVVPVALLPFASASASSSAAAAAPSFTKIGRRRRRGGPAADRGRLPGPARRAEQRQHAGQPAGRAPSLSFLGVKTTAEVYEVRITTGNAPLSSTNTTPPPATWSSWTTSCTGSRGRSPDPVRTPAWPGGGTQPRPRRRRL